MQGDVVSYSTSLNARRRRYYTVGVATKESRTEIQRAPSTAIARGLSMSAPLPMPQAKGNMPKAAAIEVIRTGRKRR